MISPDIVVRKMASSCHAFLESRCGLGAAKLKINPIAMVMKKGSNLAPFQLGKDRAGNLGRLEGWEGGRDAAMALVGRPSGSSWGGENVARAAISGVVRWRKRRVAVVINGTEEEFWFLVLEGKKRVAVRQWKQNCVTV